ncbi:MAG: hypothetical protein U9R79_08205 [Armatimonadota bacterium]|nr:hypothetical protein [Armatimonadota bacterium]
MSYADEEEIWERLDRLSEYDTVSAFAVSYYELIAEYLSGEGRAAQGLRLRLGEFLEVLERYHRAMQVFTVEEQVTLGNVRSSAEKRDIGVRVLLEQLNVDQAEGEPEIGRLLLSAECYYQLGLVDRVVERLEAAAAAGADHPLVQFALGYNRYELATQAFTRYDPQSGSRVVDDIDRFRLACLSAVGAFQDGLTGGVFDGHLHWWIGNILQAAGFEEPAQASFEKAAEIFARPGAFDEEGDQGIVLGLDVEADYEYQDREERGPITEDEVHQAAQLLRRSYSASDILDE